MPFPRSFTTTPFPNAAAPRGLKPTPASRLRKAHSHLRHSIKSFRFCSCHCRELASLRAYWIHDDHQPKRAGSTGSRQISLHLPLRGTRDFLKKRKKSTRSTRESEQVYVNQQHRHLPESKQNEKDPLNPTFFHGFPTKIPVFPTKSDKFLHKFERFWPLQPLAPLPRNTPVQTSLPIALIDILTAPSDSNHILPTATV